MADTKISNLPGLSGNYTGAELAAIVQSGVTRQTSVAQYAGKIYNVENYGTIGGGDDSVAFQAAVDAAEADGSGRVYFPKNNYKISNSTKISSGAIQLVGPGLALDYVSHACPNSPGWSIDSGKGAVIEGNAGTEIAFEFLTDAVANSSLAKEPLGLVQVSGLGFTNLNSAIVAGATNQFSFGAFVLDNCAFDQMQDWAINIENAQNIVLKQFWGSEVARGVRFGQNHDICASGTIQMHNFFLQLKSIQGAAPDYARRYGVLAEVLDGAANAFLDALILRDFFTWAIGDFCTDTIGVYCKGFSTAKSVNNPTISGAIDGDLNHGVVLENTYDAKVQFDSASRDLYGETYQCTADNTTDTFTVPGHQYQQGQMVYVDSDGGSVPTGLNPRNTVDQTTYDPADSTNSIYYVILGTGDEIQLSTIDPLRVNTSIAGFTDNGSGTLFIIEALVAIVKGVAARRSQINIPLPAQWLQFDEPSVPYSLSGQLSGFSFKSALPAYGNWYDERLAKTLYGGTQRLLAMEIDQESGTCGPSVEYARNAALVERIANSPLFMPNRLVERRTQYKYTGATASIGLDQLGYAECDPPAGGQTITLPTIGETGAQAKAGTPAVIENATGIGVITVQGGGSDTVGKSSNFVIPATVGATVFLMASGINAGGVVGNWVILGSN